jgi:hypothetical protein
MFDLLFGSRISRLFQTRSINRDAETDHSRVTMLLGSIEDVLGAATKEYSGLDARVQDVLARAAISLGNGTDEYLTRDAADTVSQNRYDEEIASGQCRLEQLSQQIKDFKFLETALLSRFPDFKPKPMNPDQRR